LNFVNTKKFGMGSEQSAELPVVDDNAKSTKPTENKSKNSVDEKRENSLIVEDYDDDEDDREYIVDESNGSGDELGDGERLDMLLYAQEAEGDDNDVERVSTEVEASAANSVLDELIAIDDESVSAGEATDVMMQQWKGSGADEMAMLEAAFAGATLDVDSADVDARETMDQEIV
jgi:hypothetical protein